MDVERILESPNKEDAAEVPDVSITEYMLQRLRKELPRLGDRDWVVDAVCDKSVKFRDIESLADGIARGLSQHGFSHGDVLYYVTYDMSNIYIMHLAVWILGGAVRGCFQKESPAEYARQIRETRSRFILVDVETNSLVSEAVDSLDWPVTTLSLGSAPVAGALSFEDLLNEGRASTKPQVQVTVNPREDVIFIPNTSGSTGLPKGVLHTHYTAVAYVHGRRNMTGLFDEAIMTPMSNFAIGNFLFIMSSLCAGCTIYHLRTFRPADFMQHLSKYKPPALLMYPFVATWFVRNSTLEGSELGFLKRIIIGGAVLDPTTAELLAAKLPHVQLMMLYGTSETMGIASTELEEDADKRKLVIAENKGELCVSSGKPIPYFQLKFVDLNSGRSLGPNERGQIFVRSPTIMKGYLTSDGQPNRSDIDKAGWYRTGDIGFYDEEGNVYVKERMSFIFKYYMDFVSPSEIESVLQQHPSVQSAGVVGIPNAETTCLARAFVVRRPGCGITEDELKQHVATRLPPYMHLHGGIRFVDELPESRGNKLDRVALLKFALQDINK